MIDPAPRGERVVEIDGVEAAPAASGAEGLVLRVTGRWGRRRPRSSASPALVVGEQRFEALSRFEDQGDDRWQASFAVPEALRPALASGLVLEVAGSRIALPAPPVPEEPWADVVDPDVLAVRRAARADEADAGEDARPERRLAEQRSEAERRTAEVAEPAADPEPAQPPAGDLRDRLDEAATNLRTRLDAERAERALAEQRERAERLEEELRERDAAQRRIEGALDGLRRQLGAVADAERAQATGGAVLDLVALAGEALEEAEQRIEHVQSAARALEVELTRERAERADYEEALKRRIAELVAAQAAPEPEPPTPDKPSFVAGPRLSGLLERLEALEARAEQEVGADAMTPPPKAPPRDPEPPPREAPPPPEHDPTPPPAVAERALRSRPLGGGRVADPSAAPVRGSGAWIGPALLALATSDPPAAGRLAVALLPAQARAAGLELDAYVMLEGAGAWRVAASPDGAAAVALDAPLGRGEAHFRLTTEPAALVDLLAGRRRLRGRPRIDIQGSRRRARRLRALAMSAPVGLCEAVRAGVDLRAELAWRAVAAAIAPAWTAGARFTVAFHPGGLASFYVHAQDGAPIAVDKTPGSDPSAAAIRGSDRAIVALLAGERPHDGDKAAIRGQLGPVRALQDWVARAQDPGRETP